MFLKSTLAATTLLAGGLIAATPQNADAQIRFSYGSGWGSNYGYGNHGHSHYNHRPYRNYGYRDTAWHDTSHYDYHPGSIQRHGNHYHYTPGHYDYHSTGHYHHYGH